MSCILLQGKTWSQECRYPAEDAASSWQAGFGGKFDGHLGVGIHAQSVRGHRPILTKQGVDRQCRIDLYGKQNLATAQLCQRQILPPESAAVKRQSVSLYLCRSSTKNTGLL